MIHLGGPTSAQGQSRTAPSPRSSLFNRFGVLLAAIAVPVMAAPGDFGAMAADAAPDPMAISARNASPAAMPFEQAGMSFPGSAFYYLADPPSQALVALPQVDPLADTSTQAGREVGAIIDAGPSARPFYSLGTGSSQARAQDCLAQAVWYEAASESEAG
ncbi:MAG: hypothetical protein AAFR88_10730, partial [Pseudomonadota bacterium]